MKKTATKIFTVYFFIPLLTVFSLIFGQEVLAQGQAELEEENVEVRKTNEFELIAKPPIKTNAEITPLPTLQVSKDAEIDFSETMTFNRLTFREIPNELAPTIPKELLGNYVKAGLGNYITPYFEGFYSHDFNERNKLGVFAHHLSSMNGVVDGQNSGYGNTNLLLFSEHKKEKFVLASSINYNLERVHYYGYDQNIEAPDKRDIRQTYHRLETKIDVSSLPKKDEFGDSSADKLAYKVSVGFNYFAARDNVSEWQIPILGKVLYSISEKSKLKIEAEFHQTGQKSNFLNIDNQTIKLKNDRTLVSFVPSYNFSVENLTLNVGAGIAYSSDSLLENSTGNTLFFYPNIDFSYQITKDKLWVLGEISGGVKPQFLRMLTVQNPFLASVQPLSHTFSQIDANLAIQAKINKNLKANAEIGFALYDNMPFFAPSVSDSSQFGLLYDKVNVLRLGVSSEYQKNSLNARLSANYFGYSLTDLDVAHHRPSFQTSLSVGYTFIEKLKTELTLQQLFGIKTQNPVSETTYDLKPINDLSISVSYKFTDQISAFANGYNLIGQNYQRFVYYPNNGITVVVGGKYIF
ncbi:TonB-dependent receptor [Bernardetia sp. Wsw4-3y2]|uniref:TonB-dependent receptor n=1 Tax=Bernardetia sp. Wsw4-3y2 TaxID=3127471 RepID=UPI0030D3986D